ADIALRLRVVDLGVGETSCVVEAGPPARDEVTGARAKALRTLVELFDEEGATFTEWLKNSHIPETTRRRVKKDLEGAGYVEKVGKGRGGKYVAAAKGRAALHTDTATARGGERAAGAQGIPGDRQDTVIQ